MTNQERESYDNFKCDCSIAWNYMQKDNKTLDELLKVQKIEAIKSCHGAEHLNTTAIPLMDGSLVTGWYYEEWGATLEEFMQNLFIKNDDELLTLYVDWIENLYKEIK